MRAHAHGRQLILAAVAGASMLHTAHTAVLQHPAQLAAAAQQQQHRAVGRPAPRAPARCRFRCSCAHQGRQSWSPARGAAAWAAAAPPSSRRRAGAATRTARRRLRARTAGLRAAQAQHAAAPSVCAHRADACRHAGTQLSLGRRTAASSCAAMRHTGRHPCRAAARLTRVETDAGAVQQRHAAQQLALPQVPDLTVEDHLTTARVEDAALRAACRQLVKRVQWRRHAGVPERGAPQHELAWRLVDGATGAAAAAEVATVQQSARPQQARVVATGQGQPHRCNTSCTAQTRLHQAQATAAAAAAADAVSPDGLDRKSVV